MNVYWQRTAGVLSDLSSNGPWRSKSVLASLAVVVVGLGIWCSGLRSNPPQTETKRAVTNAQSMTPPAQAVEPAGSHWNWSKPFPFYVRMGASYAAGFCIGWFFRRLTRLILVSVAAIIALLAFGKFAGCDMTRTEERVKRGGEWAQHEATAAESYLKHLLPSVTAGGAGIFLGYRRRSKADSSEPTT